MYVSSTYSSRANLSIEDWFAYLCALTNLNINDVDERSTVFEQKAGNINARKVH